MYMYVENMKSKINIMPSVSMWIVIVLPWVLMGIIFCFQMESHIVLVIAHKLKHESSWDFISFLILFFIALYITHSRARPRAFHSISLCHWRLTE